MDPDMVRQQEEAEREALALAAQRLTKGPAPASPIVFEAAAFVEMPVLAEAIVEAPVPPPAVEPVFVAPPALAAEIIPATRSVDVAASVSSQAPVAPKKKAHPGRRALPPISARDSRAPAPDRIRGGVFRGAARFLGYAIAGAMLGAILGNFGAAYLDVGAENNATVIWSAMGCCAFIYALISILHHEH
jgi:hypothetical protein